MNVIKKWEDDLMMCPSQCYLRIEYNGIYYVIYLRWRWDDPWSAQLIELDHMDQDVIDTSKDLISLDVNFFTHEELDKVKEDAIEKTNKYLNEYK